MSESKDTKESAISQQRLLTGDDVHVDINSPTSSGAKGVTFEDMTRIPDQKDPLEWFTWDFAMVFKVGSSEKKVKVKGQDDKISETERFQQTCASIVAKLKKGGLNVTLYKSVQDDEVYVLIGASERRLRLEADRVDYDLLLNTDECIEQGYKLSIRLAAFLKEQSKDEKGASILVNNSGWRQTYGKYAGLKEDHPDRQKLYVRYSDQGPRHEGTVLRAVDRIRLTHGIIQADELVGGCGISIDKILAKPKYGLLAYFPLHEPAKRDALLKQWIEPRNMFTQPLQQIRNYYGEKIALYFLWLGFYCHWLICPSVIGLALFIAQIVEGTVDLSVLPAYGIFVALWATLFLEFWKRKEAEHRVSWGMAHFSEREQPRPEFVGESVRNPVDGRLTKVFPWYQKIYRAVVSQVIIWTVIGAVIAGVFGVFVFRKALIKIGGDAKDVALPLSSALNAVEIQVFNVFYGWCAVKLNDFENHRTQSEYENALIGKSFIFKFVNSYNSLFYIAFFKQWDETVNYCAPRGNRDHDCLSELQVQLGVMFGLMIFVNNFIEIVAPIYHQYASAKENRAVDAQGKEIIKTPPEIEYELAPYESTFDDFDEMAIQYGYVCLFVVAFPLAPLLALLNNYIEIRLDASKISKFCRRPMPHGAMTIGTWFDILQIISFVSVITNALICVFSTTVVNNALDGDLAAKVWAFLIAEHIIIGLKLFLAYAIDDEPASMKEHLARQDYLVDVLINGKEEEPEEEIDLAKATSETKAHGFTFEMVPKKQEQCCYDYSISGPQQRGPETN